MPTAHFVEEPSYQGPGRKLGASSEAETKGVHGGEGKEKVKAAEEERGHFVESKSYQGPGHDLGKTPASANSNQPK
jgi:hypothetical protein